MLDEIDIGDLTQAEIVRVAVCQLELNDQLVQHPGREMAATYVEKVRRKLKPIFDAMHKHRPSLIQFPEVSIPKTLLSYIEEQASQIGAIVIAGTHYEATDSGIVSVCPVVFPDGRTFTTQKSTISPFEQSILSEDSVVPGDTQVLFRNTPIGDFAILVCSDFLDDDIVNEVFDHSNLDFVFVTSCQRDSHVYFNRMSHCCKNSTDGVYICYSNLKWSKYGDGNSSIFGVVDEIFLASAQVKNITDSKPREKIWVGSSPNDYAVADFDLSHKKPPLAKSVKTKPNIKIVARRDTDRAAAAADPLSQKLKLVAFDMDGPILRGLQFSWACLWEHCGDKGDLWKTYLRRYRDEEISYEEWCNEAIAFFEKHGLTANDVKSIALSKSTLTENFYEGAELLKSSGMKLALISGGVDLFLHAHVPNFDEIFDYVYINRLLVDAKGKVSGVKPTAYDFQGKALALEEICDEIDCELEQTVFVGDRFNDEWALNRAGVSIVYSQSDDVVGMEANYKCDVDDFLKLSKFIVRLNEALDVHG